MHVEAANGSEFSESELKTLEKYANDFLNDSFSNPDILPENARKVCVVTVADVGKNDKPAVLNNGEVFLFMNDKLWHQQNAKKQAVQVSQPEGMAPGLYPRKPVFDSLGRGRIDVIRVRAA